ncbi:MAG: GDP-L-fucose synthase [Bradyrhizobium sp.]|nr:MAG: GDP-L-fucose synthase [Bradyrhizobium sp.]
MSEERFSLAGKRVWVAGHRGMVGSALMRRLAQENCELLTTERNQVDLRDQSRANAWMRDARPNLVFVAAATVGGILANDAYPADFLYDNLMIGANVIRAAFEIGVDKLVFLSSSCVYPKFAPQPIAEDALLSGPLEPTNEWYAIAKIAGLKLCQAYRKQYGVDFISAMPTNLYGPGDNFAANSSHVLPALIRKAHEAKAAGASAITIWGSGAPRREFLHVDDCASALLHLAKHYSSDGPVNVGSGADVTILELTRLVAAAAGFAGRIERDLTKPDGTPRKLLDSQKIRAMGWAPSIALPEGVASVYRWFVDNHAIARGASERA